MVEPPGRPRVLVRRHILEIKEDTQDWLEEQIEEIKTAFIAGKGIGATGEALEGFLGNPTVGLWVVGALVALIGGLLGKEGAEVITDFFAKLENLHNAEQGLAQRDAASAFIQAQRALIEFFSPAFKFAPPLEPGVSPPPSGAAGGGGGSG